VAIVPEVPLDQWKPLYDAAIAFMGLEPWKWMQDSQIIGVRNPDQVDTLCQWLQDAKSQAQPKPARVAKGVVIKKR